MRKEEQPTSYTIVVINVVASIPSDLQTDGFSWFNCFVRVLHIKQSQIFVLSTCELSREIEPLVTTYSHFPYTFVIVIEHLQSTTLRFRSLYYGSQAKNVWTFGPKSMHF